MRLNTPKRQLLLIRGLGHSGTTILDLALGAHSQIVGLGEAVRLLEKPAPEDSHRGPAQLRGELQHRRLCTCGQVAAECPVWGPLLRWLPEHDDQSLPRKLNQLLDALNTAEAASDVVHPWIVESYQDDVVLPWLEDPSIEIRILHLTRDLRSWVHSRSRDGREQGQWFAGLKPLLRWCRLSSRHERLFRLTGKPVFQLGYEELALEPEHTLRRLCAWLGLPFEEAMLQPALHSTSHILSGNRMRFDTNRSASIAYDGSWMASRSGLAQLALMLPWVAALNQRLVYSGRQRSSKR